jgi:homopolymeric O-antigen transport system permease protein
MITRIDSMSRLFELTLGDVRLSREFLFFLVWRNLKARYKQTAIGVILVLIQPILNMGWFAFGGLVFFQEMEGTVADTV